MTYYKFMAPLRVRPTCALPGRRQMERSTSWSVVSLASVLTGFVVVGACGSDEVPRPQAQDGGGISGSRRQQWLSGSRRQQRPRWFGWLVGDERNERCQFRRLHRDSADDASDVRGRDLRGSRLRWESLHHSLLHQARRSGRVRFEEHGDELEHRVRPAGGA